MKILAIDYGDSRTGLSYCDRSESIAAPLGTLFEKSPEKRFIKIKEKISEIGAELIVVGHPVNMDGSEGPRAKLCEEFAKRLEAETGIRTVLWDERVTTVQAIGILNETNVRGKKRKDVIDTVAATLILEGYLDYRRKKAERESQDE